MTLTFLDQRVKVEKTTLIRIRLNAEGYTSTGHYYGVDSPLYWYAMPDGKGYIESYIRAKDREDAKKIVRALHPKRRVEFYV